MVKTNNFKRNSINSLKDTQITLSYTAPDNTQYQDTTKITVYDIGIDDPVIPQYIPKPSTGNPYYIIQAHMRPPDAFEGKLYWSWQDPSPTNQGEAPVVYFQQTGNWDFHSGTQPYSIPDSSGIVKCQFNLYNGAGDDGIVKVSTQPSGYGVGAISERIIVFGAYINVSECESVQVQRLVMKDGTFVWEPIPLKVQYDILPASGWLPDKITLKIFDSDDNIVCESSISCNQTGTCKTIYWNGKKSGVMIPYGTGYKAKIVIEKDGKVTESNSHLFDVHRVKSGSVIVRTNDTPGMKDFWHSAILITYTGGNDIMQLNDQDNYYTVIEIYAMDQGARYTTFNNFKGEHTFKGVYTKPNITLENRRAIVQRAYEIYQHQNITKKGQFDIIWLKDSPTWPLAIDNVDGLRCDGVPEWSYEKAGIMLWGTSVGQDITSSQSVVDDHNYWTAPAGPLDVFNEPDYYDLCPKTQAGAIPGSEEYTTLRPDGSDKYQLFY